MPTKRATKTITRFSWGGNDGAFFNTAILLPCLILLLTDPGLKAASLDWPDFRGPWHDGHVQAPGDHQPLGLPLHWSETENVKWKTEIPLKGWSTPIIMGGQIWLTTATEDGHDFFAICVDAQTGQIRLNQKLFHCDNPESLGAAVTMNCYATPSAVIEPGRVYLHFGSYGTACLDTATFKVLWQRDDIPCAHYRGPSSSPILFENLLILTLDGADLQYTIALDKNTGQTVWKADRSAEWNPDAAPGKNIKAGDLHKGHSTPIIATIAGKPILLSADARGHHAYDPRTGLQQWAIPTEDYSPAPRPLYDHGVAFFISGMSKTELSAVKTDDQGGTTNVTVLWKIRQHVGKYASPILVDDLLYTAADESFLTCIQAADGQVVWTERIGGSYRASPIYADGRLYFFNQQGATTVVKPGRAYESLATNTLADGLMASPAVTGKALILRTKTHLYRIESTDSGKLEP